MYDLLIKYSIHSYGDSMVITSTHILHLFHSCSDFVVSL